jgi:hypothetical protein
MIKQIVLGDIHGRAEWKRVLEAEEDYQRVIFVGDYLDTHEKHITGAMQLFNLNEIVNFKKDHPELEVILLIGNHDHHYWPGVPGGETSGYQPANAAAFTKFLMANMKMFQMAYCDENDYIYSHAGISIDWLKLQGFEADTHKELIAQINVKFKTDPCSFLYYPRDYSGYGDHELQSPIWIRPNMLSQSIYPAIQIVGHTRVRNGNIHSEQCIRRGLWLIDAMGFDHHSDYLVITDGDIKVHTLIHK